MKKTAHEPAIESPIPFRTGCNGEYEPLPVTDNDVLAERTFMQLVADKARRLGMSRRNFVGSAMGTATALWVINQVYGCGGDDSNGSSGPGGGYGVGGDMMEDAGACDVLQGDEFIFDVQTHHVNPDGQWRATNPGLEAFLASLPQGACGDAADAIGCFDVDHYIREMFVNSDTSVAVLSALPGPAEANGLTPNEMSATMALINKLADSKRSVIHAIIHPEEGPSELDGMQALNEDHEIGAWKVYTPLNGWRLDDPNIGIPFIEKARELGVTTICAHKGLPLAGFEPAFAAPDDVGVVAAAYPDVNFVVYHSAFEIGVAEGPYDENGQGVDRLIKTVLDNGIAANTGNVYAELGSTWRLVMTNPDAAAHIIGKLLLYLGEERVVWGTDSIWYGSPQDQIAAFRAFQISDELQQTHGYPALTPALKAKVFGLNSAALYGIDPEAQLCAISEDAIAQRKQAVLHEPALRTPSFRAVGPSTRREWFDFLRLRGGRPG